MASNELTRDRAPAAGLILAGGRSKRMGVNKALLDVGGAPLITRVLGAFDTLTPVVIVGGRHEDFKDLDAAWCGDEQPGEGPLGALISGMHQLQAEIVVAAACDLPHLASNSVEQLIDELRRSSAGVAAPLVSGTHQWHVAAWRRAGLESLELAFARGERSLRHVANELGVVSVVFADNANFVDVDTPDDFSRAFPE